MLWKMPIIAALHENETTYRLRMPDNLYTHHGYRYCNWHLVGKYELLDKTIPLERTIFPAFFTTGTLYGDDAKSESLSYIALQ